MYIHNTHTYHRQGSLQQWGTKREKYVEEIEFDKLYDIDFLTGKFGAELTWVE